MVPKYIFLLLFLLLIPNLAQAANLTYTPDGETVYANITPGDTLWVGFVDVSTEDPLSWQWNATNVTPGNNTPFTFSTNQTVMYGFGTGLWMINLSVTNASGITSAYGYISINYAPDTTLPSGDTYRVDYSESFAAMHILWLLPMIIGMTLMYGAFTSKDMKTWYFIAGVISIMAGLIMLLVIFGMMGYFAGAVE